MKISELDGRQVVAYIGELSAELAKMAEDLGFDYLSHCLAMAASESNRLNLAEDAGAERSHHYEHST